MLTFDITFIMTIVFCVFLNVEVRRDSERRTGCWVALDCLLSGSECIDFDEEHVQWMIYSRAGLVKAASGIKNAILSYPTPKWEKRCLPKPVGNTSTGKLLGWDSNLRHSRAGVLLLNAPPDKRPGWIHVYFLYSKAYSILGYSTQTLFCLQLFKKIDKWLIKSINQLINNISAFQTLRLCKCN